MAKRAVKHHTLRQQLEKSNTQIQSLSNEKQHLKKDSHQKDQQIVLLQSETQLLQKELFQYQQNIAVLQEEKLVLMQERNSLMEAINKKGKQKKIQNLHVIKSNFL